ncbi:MAG: TIM-barrel domain-containing protein [Anaerolineae bacterium]
MITSLVRLIRNASKLELEALRAAAVYPFRKAWVDATWTPSGRRRHGLSRWRAYVKSLGGPSPAWPRRWHPWQKVQAIRPVDWGAVLELRGGNIEILFLTSDFVRVRYSPPAPGTLAPPLPYGIASPPEAWALPEISAISLEHAYVLYTDTLVVGIHLGSGRLFFGTPKGELLRADVDAAWGEHGALRHRAALVEGERLFGLGERATPLDRRGRTHVLWNTDPGGYTPGEDPINLNIPVYVGAVPTQSGAIRSYLAFYENASYAEFDLGESAPHVAEHRFAGGELRYYFAAGPLPTLVERYTALTGRHRLQPLWMLGYQQSRWSYEDEARVRKLAQNLRRHRIPCDAIHLDIDYMDGFRCFTWNRDRFPDPAQLAADLRAGGLKLIAIIDPGIKRDPDYAAYREGLEAGHFCRLPNGEVFHAPVWPGESAFPDFTSPQTRRWWGGLYRALIEDGVAGFWNDMNEPSAFGQIGDKTLPSPVRHTVEGEERSHWEAHNVYGMLMVRATQEGIEALSPDTRPVVITRAGWAGVQRYATSWTGDNESTWESLRLTVPMMLGLGLSGVGFSGADVGGFAGAPDGELFTRWVQMGAFMPFFRAHTAKHSPEQEPWSYGEPFLSIVRRFIELRYELLPYLYTAMWQLCTRGWPMVRPLAWFNPADPSLWDIDDAFLCGDSLLVAPVMAPGASRRPVQLPPGTWYDFWTNRPYTGESLVDQYAPLETMPLFVRAGTVLTMGETGPSVEGRRQKFLRLSLYLPREPGETVTELYEDAGSGLGYREGAFRLSRFRLRREGERVTLTWEAEGAYDPPYEHIELTINGLDRVPRAVRADGDAYAVVQADSVRRTVLLGVPRFEALDIQL